MTVLRSRSAWVTTADGREHGPLYHAGHANAVESEELAKAGTEIVAGGASKVNMRVMRWIGVLSVLE